MATPRKLGTKRHSAVEVVTGTWKRPGTQTDERMIFVKIGRFQLGINLDAKEFAVKPGGNTQMSWPISGGGGGSSPKWPPNI